MSATASDLYQQALAAEKSGNNAHAITLYQQVIQQSPEHADAHHMLGTVYLAEQRLPDALAWLQKAAALAPDNLNVLMNLATALRMSGQLQPAIGCYEKVIQRNPQFAAAYEGIGLIFAQAQKNDDAIRFLRKALSLDASLDNACFVLAKLLLGKGLNTGAAQLLKRLSEKFPEDARIVMLYGQALRLIGRFEEAIAQYQTLLKVPEHANDARSCLATLYLDKGEPERCLEMVAALPDSMQQRADVLGLKGQALNLRGEADAATECYLQSIRQNPEFVKTWYLLLSLRPAAVSSEQVSVLEQAAEKQQGLDRAIGFFALARLYEHQKQWEKEFHALEEANRVQQQFSPHSCEELTQANAMLRTHITAPVVQSLAEKGNRTVKPVFIYGLPRSGTTLTEQLLSSHPRVQAAGEARAFFSGLEQQSKDTAKLGDLALEASNIDAGKLAEFYVSRLREEGITASVFTDKAIRNFQVLGLHVAAFPEAKLIRVDRHPMDVCFGAWKMLFNQGRQNFSYNLKACAHMYVEFHTMMDHWEATLPNPVFHLSYEELVSNQEEVTRKLLAFCDLPWDDACLRFHENKRKVQTASINQVRKGLYTSALARWKRYGDLLNPLREELERLGVTIPE